jgi:RHS repeat-associated protein
MKALEADAIEQPGTTHKFTGKERDPESGLDYLSARYYSSNLGRFSSPDPLGGHQEDAQTLNRYAYVRNNPLNLTDPTGLDFNLYCQKESDTCQKTKDGYLVQGQTTTDESGKRTFQATVVTSASLRDPKSGNTGTVNENGVQITTKDGIFQGAFIKDTPAADLQGSGKLTDFSFHIDSNCGGTCLSSGTFQYNGTPDQTRYLLDQRGAYRSAADRTIPGVDRSIDEMVYHWNTTQHRFGVGPSPHFSVPRDSKSTVPTWGPFHVDKDAPGAKHLGCATLGVGCK